MKVMFDTNLVRHIKMVEVKSRDEWLNLVTELGTKDCRPNSTVGPSAFPCMVIISNTPLWGAANSPNEVNVEFVYNYEVLPEELLQAA